MSRRTVLAAGIGVTATLAGCSDKADDKPAPPAGPDPLQPVLDDALALTAAYQRAAIAQPGLAARLAPLAADHQAHVDELSKLMPIRAASVPGASAPGVPAGVAGAAAASAPGASVSSAASAPGSVPAAADVLNQLRAAEQTAQKNAAASCRTAPAGRAALLGSISACRGTHAEALR